MVAVLPRWQKWKPTKHRSFNCVETRTQGEGDSKEGGGNPNRSLQRARLGKPTHPIPFKKTAGKPALHRLARVSRTALGRLLVSRDETSARTDDALDAETNFDHLEMLQFKKS